jgi:hypothetical protein
MVIRREASTGAPAAAATTPLPVAAGELAALDLWRRYRANQVEFYGAIRPSWAAATEDGDNDPIAERASRFDVAESELVHAIQALESSGPIAIAAKLNLAFDHAHRADYIEDLPWCMLASVLRTLLPTLPAEMAAALQPLTAGRRESATPIGQGLRAVFPGWQSPGKRA